MATRRQKSMRDFLREQPREDLANWLLGVSGELPEFRQRLEHYASTQTHPEAELNLLKAAFRELAQLAGRDASPLKVTEIAPRASLLRAAVEALLDRGQLLDAFEWCGRCAWLLDMAMTRLATESIRLRRLLDAFENLHHRIVEQKPVDPATLAICLYERQVNSANGFLAGAIETYKDLLGETGLAAYRHQLDHAYQVLVAGEAISLTNPLARKIPPQEARLLRIWGKFTGDPAEKAAIAIAFARDPEEVLSIAGVLGESAGKTEAIAAVLAACDRFQHPPPLVLFEYLAAHFEAEGHFERALEYRWEHYRAQPSELSYRLLLASAAPLQVARETREAALDVAAEKNNSLYSRLLLLEGRQEEALEQARAHGATTEVWALLARSYAAKDPHQAIHLFFDCAKYSMRTFRGDACRRSSEFLGEAWSLTGDVQTFQTFNLRLKNFFGQQGCPPRLEEAVEEAGIPLRQLLKN